MGGFDIEGSGSGTVAASEYDSGNTSTAKTIDWSLGVAQKSTLTGNCTYTFSNPTAGEAYILRLVQDATGSRTVTWPASVKWTNSNTPPILSTVAAKVDLINFYYDGTYYYGSFSVGY